MDCVIEPTRDAVWQREAALKMENKDQILRMAQAMTEFERRPRVDPLRRRGGDGRQVRALPPR